MKFILLPLFWPLYAWLTIATAFPTNTGNYEFMHVPEKEGLTISISKNSPPLAAISDEALPELKVEPAIEVPRPKNSTYIVTENKSAWSKLEKVSKHFEKQQRAIKAQQVRAQAQVNAPVRTIAVSTAPIHREQKQEVTIAPHTRISELINLVHPVNYAVYPAAYKNAGVVNELKPIPPAAKLAARTAPTEYIFTAPSVPRGLPRGEDAPGRVLDRVPQSSKQPARKQEIVRNEKIPVAPPVEEKKMKQESIGFDGGGQVDPSSIYTLMGQVELSGGLAVGVNTLKVEWKTGQDARPGVVDYNNGLFTIQVPNISTGKIFATLTDGEQRLIGQGVFDLNDEDPSNIKILVEPIVNNIRGTVMSAYSYGNVKIPVEGAEVFAPSQIREMPEKDGNYKIQGLGSDSTFILEAYAPENWGTRVISESQRMERVPLFSNRMIQSLFDLVGEPTNNTEFGVIWGEVKKKNNSVGGVEVALNSKDAIGPIYFNEFRIPDKKLTSTSSNGLFAFIKVPAGLHVVHTRKQGVELPSKVIAAAPSLVSYSEINLRALNISGRVYDPQLKQNIPSNISIVGASQTAQSAQDGFKMKIASSEAVLHMDANSGADYFVTRAAIARSRAKKVTILAIAKKWLTDAMIEAQVKQDPQGGMLLGSVGGQGFSVVMDNEKVSDESVFYFGESGKIETERADSPDKGGMFLMTNLKPGLHTVVITSKDGQTTNTQIVVSQAGILNVLYSELR